MHILVRNSYTAILVNDELFPVDFYFFHILLYQNDVTFVVTQAINLELPTVFHLKELEAFLESSAFLYGIRSSCCLVHSWNPWRYLPFDMHAPHESFSHLRIFALKRILTAAVPETGLCVRHKYVKSKIWQLQQLLR